tara:strand:- start:920 stop:1099 length:180 start_codon:yes stop_codon:yes gene_type:complete
MITRQTRFFFGFRVRASEGGGRKKGRERKKSDLGFEIFFEWFFAWRTNTGQKTRHSSEL